MSEATWPGGARGALSLTFDNLGEAAEIELGAVAADAPLGDHFTAKRVLPALLDSLGERDLAATFFVEGLNAELYPDELSEIAGRGHEVGYHAWRHEQWTSLGSEEQADNLRRGAAAFAELGIEPAGFRPPGGGLDPIDATRTETSSPAAFATALRSLGLRYCSPAGSGVGIRDGVALLPFQWRHVDATCVLPPFAAVREAMTGSPDPLDPAAFVAFLDRELTALAADGGYVTIVLHLFMLNWLGDRLAALLDRVAEASGTGELWVARCADVADRVLASPERFGDDAVLDQTSWTNSGD